MSRVSSLVPWLLEGLVAAGLVASLLITQSGMSFWLLAIGLHLTLRVAIHALLSPRIRMLASIAFRDITVRRRSIAIVFFGLMLGSGVITSSLAVGDSFDATLEDRLVSSLGQTDWVIEGTDPITGMPVMMNQDRIQEALDVIMSDSQIDGVSVELHTSVSAIRLDGSKVDPSAVWLAPNLSARSEGPWYTPESGWSALIDADEVEGEPAFINQAFADSMGLVIGDSVDISWTVMLDEEIERQSHQFEIIEILPSTGLGWPVAVQPLLITDIDRAQALRNLSGIVTRAVVSGQGSVMSGYLHEGVEQLIENAFSTSMIAEDSGFVWSNAGPGETMILTRSSAGGLLQSGDVGGVDSTLSGVSSEVRSNSIAILPIGNVLSEEGRWTVLPGKEILGIYPENTLEPSDVVIVTDEGIVNISMDGSVSVDLVDGIEAAASSNHYFDGSAIQFHEPTNKISTSYPIAPPTDEPFSMAVSDAVHVSFATNGSANLMRYDGSNWIPIPIDISDSVDFSTLVTDGEIIAVLFSGLFGSHVCMIEWNTTTCIDSGLANKIALIDGHVFVHGPNGVEVWDTEPGLSQLPLENASFLSLTSAGVVVDEGTLLVPSTNLSSLIPGPSLPPNSDGQFVVVHNETVISSTHLGVISSSPSKLDRPFLFDGHELGLGIRIPTLLVAEEGGLEFGDGELLLRSDFIANTSTYVEVEKHLTEDYYSLNISAGSVSISELLLYGSDLEPIESAILGVITMEAAERVLGSEVPRTSIHVDLPQDPLLAAQIIDALNEWADARADLSTSDASIVEVKREAVESIEGAGESFSILFLTFGTFIIAAGAMLIVNLQVISADDRKRDWGILRAIGGSSNDIGWIIRIEGVILSVPASIFGSFLGLVVAGLMMSALDAFFIASFGVGFSFSWAWSSVIIGSTVGFLLSTLTLSLTALFLSRKDVLSNLRDLPPSASSSGLGAVMLSLMTGAGAIALWGMFLLVPDTSGGLDHLLWVSGGCLLILTLYQPLSWAFTRLLPTRSEFLSSTHTGKEWATIISSSIVGILMPIWVLFDGPIRSGMEPSDLSLIVSGAFMVIGSVMLAGSLGPIFVGAGIRRLFSSRPRYSAMSNLALSYPQAQGGRTLLTMGTYSVVVFALIVLSGYSASFGAYIEDIGEDARGEYDIVIVGAGQGLDISVMEAWSNQDMVRNGIESYSQLEIGTGILTAEDVAPRYTQVRGFNASFIDGGALPLSDWDSSIAEDQKGVWLAVLSDPSLAIVDASVAQKTYTSLGSITQTGLGLGIGSSIDLRDPQRSMLHTEVRIVGVLDEDASFLMSGVLLREDSVASLLSSTEAMVWADVQNGQDSKIIAESLQGELGADGATVLVVEELFDQIRIVLVSLLGLVRAFLAIGLLVGIIGLAVVTNRSLKQRHMQIGVMRAIGFQPREVFMTFGLEVLWTSGVGVISGGVVGFLLHWVLHRMVVADDGGAFVIPVLEFVMIPLFAILFSLFATAPSVLRITQFPPHSVMKSVS